MAERAGYTVTMFVIDVSPSMGKTKYVDLSDGTDGHENVLETTNLEWSLHFVRLKIQEMIYNGRKTDQCGVILFGTEDADNIVNTESGGYDHVTEFIPIGQPNAGTLAKLATLEPSTEIGDPFDALIVATEVQQRYLAKKKTWTRKMVLVTDGENPIEIEDWETIVDKMNTLSVSLTIIGIDFDDEDFGFQEEIKSKVKFENEKFFHKFVNRLISGVIGNCDYALSEISRPDISQKKSALLGMELRIGDTINHPEASAKIQCKVSKCTALQRPKSWKKFAVRPKKDKENNADEDEQMDIDEEEDTKKVFAQLTMRTEYYVDTKKDEDEKSGSNGKGDMDEDGSETEDEDNNDEAMRASWMRLEKEELIRGYKYGSDFVPCPEPFPSLPSEFTRKGIDICGFFPVKGFRRDQAMGEVQYVWADPTSPLQQAALSSLVQAMYEKGSLAIARWCGRDGADPKVGVLSPMVFDNVDCFLWVRMPFADDVRKYTFASLDKLVNKNGSVVEKHPYIPTDEQLEAMDEFVDAMDLMEAGEEDDAGERQPWFDTRLSYNPAVHRTKQALFHGACVQDLNAYPVPEPHPDILKYFDPPRRVVKRAKQAVEDCKQAFKVREVPKHKATRVRKDGHVIAQDEDEDLLLNKVAGLSRTQTQLKGSPSRKNGLKRTQTGAFRSQAKVAAKKISKYDSASETESEEDEDLNTNAKEEDGKDGVEKGKRKAVKAESSMDAMPPPPLPTKTKAKKESRASSPEPMEVESQTQTDYKRAPGRIIGETYPLDDFRKNIATGDIVSKAVEDFGWVIKEIVMKPFASRRYKEVMECLKVLRSVCLEEDEIDAWNEFLQDLKKACLGDDPGNEEFWTVLSKEGRNMSLISKPEAAKVKGQSDISEATAAEFMRKS